MAAMAWVRNWFGLDDGTSLKQAQDEFRINHSPTLIGELKGDHAELLNLYGQIEAMATGGELPKLYHALKVFKSKFDLHVLTENVKFYCYIEQRLARRPDALRVVKEFRREMNHIGRGVVTFVKKWRESGVNADNNAAFLAELRQVGALLVQRVEREERDLYTLYA